MSFSSSLRRIVKTATPALQLRLVTVSLHPQPRLIAESCRSCTTKGTGPCLFIVQARRPVDPTNASQRQQFKETYDLIERIRKAEPSSGGVPTIATHVLLLLAGRWRIRFIAYNSCCAQWHVCRTGVKSVDARKKPSNIRMAGREANANAKAGQTGRAPAPAESMPTPSPASTSGPRSKNVDSVTSTLPADEPVIDSQSEIDTEPTPYELVTDCDGFGLPLTVGQGKA